MGPLGLPTTPVFREKGSGTCKFRNAWPGNKHSTGHAITDPAQIQGRGSSYVKEPWPSLIYHEKSTFSTFSLMTIITNGAM